MGVVQEWSTLLPNNASNLLLGTNGWLQVLSQPPEDVSMMRQAFLLVITLCTAPGALMASGGVSDYNVLCASPSTTSQSSMPLGNGDIGLNLWMEHDRDLVFYLSKTDTWDENGSLLKLGRIRVRLPEGTLAASRNYRQELRLNDGTIQIDVGVGTAATTIIVWIDPNAPDIHIDVQRQSAFNAIVAVEPWRLARRQLTGQELDSAYGLTQSPTPVYVEPDTVVGGQTNRVLWYHRNERSVWAQNLTLQGLRPSNTLRTDPLIHNTFGAAITGLNVTNVDSTILKTTQATKHQVFSVHAFTAQTDTAQQWVDQLNQRITQTEMTSYDQRKAANDRWWNAFNQQSYIHITGGPNAAIVSQGYALQRAMNAFAGRGVFPIKFNGSIFTVDTNGRTDLGAEANLNADYRRWGGPYWMQNTRLIYWPMLQCGDFQQMHPFFDMYLKNLGVAKERVQTYYGGQGTKGAYFPETMTPWGTWTNDNYGWNNVNRKGGMASNTYIRYVWQGGLELSAMMLQYFDFTGDQTFVSQKLLPLATEIIDFYDTHYSRDPFGKLSIQPAQALETWATAINPMPEVAGLQYVLGKLLALPQSLTTAQKRTQWSRLSGQLPAIPTQTLNGQLVFAPAQQFSAKQNTENAELYGVFPYLLSGVDKSNLRIGINTYSNRTAQLGAWDWSQDSIHAAMLGMADAAKQLVIAGFSNKAKGSRFLGFYGPNADWIGEQNQGNVASAALQRMLLHVDGDDMAFFPAWPSNWDTQFKLFGSKNRIVMGKYKNGAVQWMDPGFTGELTKADYQLVMAHLGYNNGKGKGDLTSPSLGDVNLDGCVNDADRVALLAGAADFGVDTSNWTIGH